MFQDLLVKITGTKEIYIENYKNLLDYKEDIVAVQGKHESVFIRGSNFLIDYFANDGMKITGCITSIEFCQSTKKSGRR